jgi:hypothetical protein
MHGIIKDEGPMRFALVTLSWLLTATVQAQRPEPRPRRVSYCHADICDEKPLEPHLILDLRLYRHDLCSGETTLLDRSIIRSSTWAMGEMRIDEEDVRAVIEHGQELAWVTRPCGVAVVYCMSSYSAEIGPGYKSTQKVSLGLAVQSRPHGTAEWNHSWWSRSVELGRPVEIRPSREEEGLEYLLEIGVTAGK